MYIHTSAFEHFLPGEPTPEALHRQEYFEGRETSAEHAGAELIEPNARQRAMLLRARVVTGVGRYFA